MPYIKTPNGEKYVDDFINTIKVGDKIYALQASIVEVSRKSNVRTAVTH